MKNKVKTNFGRRLACVGLTVAMCSTFIAGQVLAFADGKGVTAAGDESYNLEFGSAQGKVDLTDIKLSNLSEQVLKNTEAVASQVRSVIVTLEGQPLSDATDLSARKELEREQAEFLKKLSKAGVDYSLRSSYVNIANAVAIEVKLGYLATIKSIDGVKTVSVGSTYARPKEIKTFEGATTNDSNIYANGIYNSSEYVKKGIDGSGMTVAILDTGLDYTHEAFAASKLNDASKNTYDYEKVERLMDDTAFAASRRTSATVADVYVSDKVPFAYDYADDDADVYPSYSQHGTHVAGIVAGKADSYNNKDGDVATDDKGNILEFRGVAPEAQLVICKVFTDNLDDDAIGGAEAPDIMDALEDCCNLDVDVINMSLGTSSGFSSKSLGLTEEDEEGILMKAIYERIREKGISMIVAASNDFSAGYGSAFGTNLASNPDSGTVGSPSTFTGSMAVASINGQLSSYLVGKGLNRDKDVTVYYDESRNEDSDAYNFLNDMLGDPDPKSENYDPNYKNSATYRYVVVDGIGAAGDYTASIRAKLADKSVGGKTLALIRRGSTSFKDKIETAAANGADGVIVYNNVSGMIRMSLGDMEEHVPAISISMEAGLALRGSGADRNEEGTITLDRTYLAGPFMNDYSSWGCTPDLKLKPDVTSHGGEITSTVAGGYAEMSGTSMACPNLAGFTALLRGEIKKDTATYGSLWQNEENSQLALTRVVNNIMMSTATTVYDQSGLPYSPRKQGAGLATLNNVFSTRAYLYTEYLDVHSDDEKVNEANRNNPLFMCEDGRPKAELGDDPAKNGVYNITFYVKNFGDKELKFKTNSIFMTETIGVDGMSVAEKAHLFGDDAAWKIDGLDVEEGKEFLVKAGESVKIQVTLTLTPTEKAYLDTNFKNGMFVEGYLQLLGSDGQCDLTFSFMGFYGDWTAAPMLDLDCFEIATDAKDTSLKDEDRRQPSVFATQAYSYYYNEKYVLPMGSFVYRQDEDKEHTADYVYTEEEHSAISRFNEYFGEGNTDNYMSSTGVKALYAGLLRNAEVVTYTLTNVDTGEIVPDANGNEVREIYRVNKAYSGGGSAVPAQVLLELRTHELGLAANGKYRLDFAFYFDYNDKGKETDDTFSFSFYVDYEAPILQDTRIRFRDGKDENNKDVQQVYLDLDIFENHYPQAVMLCYSEEDDGTGDIEQSTRSIKLATEYIIPIINPRKNTTNTVTVEITDLYEEYKGRLFVEIDDYALNSSVYYINLDYSRTTAVCPENFKVTYQGSEVTELTIPANTAVKLGIDGADGVSLSNFNWSVSSPSVARVKDGEIFGVRAGRTTLTVRGGNNISRQVTIRVEDSNATLEEPRLSFGMMVNCDDVPVKASGIVRVNPGQQFKLSVTTDPWYFSVDKLDFEWAIENADKDDQTEYARVTQDGRVSFLYEGEDVKLVTVRATVTAGTYKGLNASVTLAIQDPYTITNGVLTKYKGLGGEKNADGVRVLTIPSDRSITSIGEEAFKENENVEIVIIPKQVATIGERAFLDCKNLKEIYFIQQTAKEVNDAQLNLIYRTAFSGCTGLEKVDFTNCKVFTLDKYVFTGCTALKEVVGMDKVGTAGDETFAGCTSLEQIDISKLHVAGYGVFADCTALETVIISDTSAIGDFMFMGCTKLKNSGSNTDGLVINCRNIPMYAFYGCTALTTVTLGKSENASAVYQIGASAFANCSNLSMFDLNGKTVISIDDYGFAGCTSLNNLYDNEGFAPELGLDVFHDVTNIDGLKVIDGVLYSAPKHIDEAISFAGITEIAPYAFSGSVLAANAAFDLSGVTKIGRGAFYGLGGLTGVTLSSQLEEIPAGAFYGTSLTTVSIPASVKKIGNLAFNGCSSLTSVEFADGSQLTSIGIRAFDSCGFTEISLPDGVTSIGDEAFASCASLKTAEVSSVKEMGKGVFAFCPALERVTFGENAETAGSYTFFGAVESYSYGGRNYSMYTSAGALRTSNSSLTTVELSGKIKVIEEGVFAYCTALTEIDLKNVTTLCSKSRLQQTTEINGYRYKKGTEVIEGYEFFNCEKLAKVTGLNKVEEVGPNAFAYCSALTGADLSGAESIYYRAFFLCDSLGTVTFGDKLQGIGDEAFAETALSEVTIPVNCSYVGASAFSGLTKLAAYKVAEGSKYYFTDKGVLYRYIDKEKGVYELTSFPLGKPVEKEDGVATYKVIDGTINILAFAFYGVDSGLTRVVLPYTLKTIGNGAFFASKITSYRFESIAAPVLLEDVSERVIEKGQYSANSFFYNNFAGYLANVTAHYPWDTPANASDLSMQYPTNGTGYDNYIYQNYFGTKVTTGEQPEDNTRTLKDMIISFADPATISGWNLTNPGKEYVQAFADDVKKAHALYNGLKSDEQKAFVGQENIDKLFAVEQALKPVKVSFGITVRVNSVVLDAGSEHKSEYVAGEKFSLDGLKLLVTYDDYTQEVINAKGNFQLVSRFDRALRASDEAVMLEGTGKYAGRTVGVNVKVTEGKEGGDKQPLGTVAIVLIVVGVVVVAAVVAVVTVVLLKKRSAGGSDTVVLGEKELADSEASEDNGEQGETAIAVNSQSEEESKSDGEQTAGQNEATSDSAEQPEESQTEEQGETAVTGEDKPEDNQTGEQNDGEEGKV